MTADPGAIQITYLLTYLQYDSNSLQWSILTGWSVSSSDP